MSLVGNLEDLGLGDILQIISLSQKSGALSLERKDGAGKIFFSNGQVIRATSCNLRLNLGDLLVRQGLVNLETVKDALRRQQDEGGGRCIGSILAEDFGLDRSSIEEVVKGQIETIVYSFFSWDDGTFAFELGDQKILGDAALNPLSFLYAKGLNPQWLALEGSKRLDEGALPQSPQTDPEAAPVTDWSHILEDAPQPVLPVPIEEPASEHRPKVDLVLAIDDDPTTRAALEKEFVTDGIEAQLFADATKFIDACQEASNKGLSTLALVDLIMPRQDGGGVLGGLEVIEQLKKSCPTQPYLLMSDHPNAASARQLQQYGVEQVLVKPKKQEILEQRYQEGMAFLLRDLAVQWGKMKHHPPNNGAGRIDIAGEIMDEIGEPQPHPRPTQKQNVAGLNLLKNLLEELAQPGPGGEIILLILRFASELMSRAIVLRVREHHLADMGQFGFDMTQCRGGLRIPRDTLKGTPLETILNSPRSLRLDTLEGLSWVEQFESPSPTDIYLAPLISQGKIVALLYGDNALEGRPIGDTAPLEIFLSQAGLAMEKIILEKRLQGGI